MRKTEEVRFGWIDPGMFNAETASDKVQINNPFSQPIPRKDHGLSKLTPFMKINGVWETMTPEKDVDIALDYREAKENNPPEVNKEIEDTLHRGIELKEFIRCSRCHSEKGILNFNELGFHPGRVEQLQKMEMEGIFTDYDTLFFPKFFEEQLQ